MAGTVIDLFRLDGRVAIVTGASKGLGAALALALAEAGADVALVARGDLSQTVASIEATGRKALPIQADLGNRMETAAIVPQAVKAFDRVDILVNNAGIIRRAPLLEFSEDDWDTVLEVNLSSAFILSQAFARAVTAEQTPRIGRAKILNIASLLSFQGGIRVPSYTASKSGLMGLTRLLANELAEVEINVNGIAPGYMETDNTEALRSDAKRNRAILDRIPMRRWGKPDDLKGAAVFLCSPASDYVTGFTLAVDGGWLAR